MLAARPGEGLLLLGQAKMFVDQRIELAPAWVSPLEVGDALGQLLEVML